MKQRVRLNIKGVVQGVGFRPYVFRLSGKFRLAGCVFNDSKGVTIELEGSCARIKKFLKELTRAAPAISSINKIKKKIIPLSGETKFTIIESRPAKNKTASFPADIAMCDDCYRELFNKANRRHHFPFINCTNCGPRFSIIEDIPYDREKTTMKKFEMCPSCLSEYLNPANRRFHAEPNACFSCGPQIGFFAKAQGINKKKFSVNPQETLKKAAKLIAEGKIIAIKGIGGYHLACNAKNIKTLRRLRRLKNRPAKPFAVMLESVEDVSTICNVSGSERKLLSGAARPITLLEIKKKMPWIDEVAPSQDFLGVMLCYAPLHYLLFSVLKGFEKNPVLVMTSANRGDFPLVASENELTQIADYADYFLTHSRPIHVKCDDSIARVFLGEEIISRKARGYTPDFMNFSAKQEIFACGAELKNTFSFCSGKYLVSSPYIGDLKNYATYKWYLKIFSHYKKIMNFKPKIVAHDLHPSYLSTQYALSLKDTRKIPVQHHHAHLAACLFENGVSKKAIGVCFDGAGLGADNAIWGGEFFITDKRDFLRVGHFGYFGLLGSDKAVEEPARVAFYMLYKIFGENLFKLKFKCVDYFKKTEKNIFCKLIDNNEVVMASSAGRIFDAVASILDLKHKISYEAEAAVALEMFSRLTKPVNRTFAFSINKENNIYIINWQDIISDIIKSLKANEEKPAIAYRFHFTFAKIIKEIAVFLRQDYGINDVALSGGVFQNFLLLKLAVEMLKKEGFNVHYHKRIPTNDSGISIGQAVVASERTQKE